MGSVRRGRRWSRASRVFLGLAVVLGGAAFILVRGYAARVDALAPAVGPTVPLLVAARDLTRGTTLTPDMVRLSDVPSAYAPPGAVQLIEDAAGRTLVSDLAAWEPVTRTRIGSAREGPLASLVPAGMRAMEVPAAADPGAIRPGDHVDILATFGGGQPHTETAGVDLEVISVAPGSEGASSPTSSESSGGGGPSITLLVTPDEAENLANASAFATISISVLGREDANTTTS